MPIYKYKCRDESGLKIGKRSATSPDNLYAQLITEGMTPISIESSNDFDRLWPRLKAKLLERPVTNNELSAFSRQMYALCKSAVPISQALKHLAEGSKNPSLANALNGCAEGLESGLDLASAMQNFPKVFPPIFVAMVKVGLSSGELAQSFMRLSQFLDLESTATQNFKTALRYPTFVLITLFFAIIIINVFVIPSFSKIFLSSKVPLPWPTMALMTVSDFMVHYWQILLGVVFLIGVSLYYYFKTPRGRWYFDKWILHLPIVGRIFKHIILLRFAQSFAVIMESGVELMEGIELVAYSVVNTYARECILTMRESLEHGNNLTQAAAGAKLFSPLELQMMSVSEETGELPNMFNQIASYYRREVDYDLKRVSDLVEPVIILILGAVILILALAVYLPVWNMVKLTKPG
jgi:MSHA biogenesis protein MshG